MKPVVAWVAVLLLTILLARLPVSTNITRLAQVACLVGLWGAAIWAARRRVAVLSTLVGLSLVVALVLALVTRPFRGSDLRDHYVQSLFSYQGTPYVWGGENDVGIDCSGLIRKSLIVSLARSSVAQVNPALLREALFLWAHDATAAGLMSGYRGHTRPLSSAASINALDDSSLLPGDFVVTANGVHTLAYVDDHTWIEAEPGIRGVVSLKAPQRGDNWFETPVQVMRWTIFEAN